MIAQTELKRIITACPAELPRTDALQNEIKIGVGYHGKWYRSQKEHWLGWIVFQEHKARANERDIASITAKQRWSGLNCIPMMFWLAEAIGVEDSLLTLAEEISRTEAAIISHDCPRHGKAIRQVLPWSCIEKKLQVAEQASMKETNKAGKTAFAHLALKRSKYRKFLDEEEDE